MIAKIIYTDGSVKKVPIDRHSIETNVFTAIYYFDEFNWSLVDRVIIQ